MWALTGGGGGGYVNPPQRTLAQKEGLPRTQLRKISEEERDGQEKQRTAAAAGRRGGSLRRVVRNR